MQPVVRRVPSGSPALGFGCTALSASDPAAHHDALLHAVWDSGIRWFDVARLYSYGAAEESLGRFLRGRRDEAFVVTKFGLSPPASVARSAALRSVARRLTAATPSLRKRLAARADSGVVAGDFSVEAATRSLEQSLRALRTDRVDALLLHEVRPGQVDDALHAWLQDQVDRGTVGQWGTATPPVDVTREVLARHPWTGQLVQVEESLQRDLPSDLAGTRTALVTHSVLKHDLAALREQLSHPLTRARLAELGGVDPADSTALGPLLLAAALTRRTDGVVLFSSRDLARCRAAATAPATVSPQQAAAVRDLLADRSGAAGG